MKHITRYSDSSLYDERCVLCGATDGRHDDSLEKPCPAHTKNRLKEIAAELLNPKQFREYNDLTAYHVINFYAKALK